MSTTTANGRKPRAAKTATAAAKPAASRSEDVSLNLDTLEREDRKDPFTFLHLGRRYVIADPQEMDWQEQMRAYADPIYFLQHAMSAEDVEEFFKAKMPAWKLDVIMKAYQAHFALPSSGE